MTLYALIMAGGTGSRLWPRSRRNLPKQFLPLFGERTMVQETMDRIAPIVDPAHTMIVTGHDYVRHAVEQMEHVPLNNIIAEPSGKGTAPAIGLGAVEIAHREPGATMAVLSADHMIRKARAFRQALLAAEQVAQQGYLVTLGIKPSEAHTGYGYIQRGASIGTFGGFDAYEVARFVEKPNRQTAEGYVSEGNYSWNAGIFVWRADAILQASLSTTASWSKPTRWRSFRWTSGGAMWATGTP
jgi:mannose-1-phosphate guanylyltransferase